MMDLMCSTAEEFYQELEIPYRIVNIVSGMCIWPFIVFSHYLFQLMLGDTCDPRARAQPRVKATV